MTRLMELPSPKAMERLKQIEYAKLNGVPAACREYGVGKSQLYEWRSRYKRDGLAGLEDVERKPGHHPDTTTDKEINLLRDLQLKFPDTASEHLSRCLAEKGHKRSAVTVRKLVRKGLLLSPKEVAEDLQRRNQAGTRLKKRQRKFVIEKNPRFMASGKIGTKPGATIFVSVFPLQSIGKLKSWCVHLIFDTFSGFVFGRVSEHKATLDVLTSLRELIGRQKLPRPERIVWLKRPNDLTVEQDNGLTEFDPDFDGYRLHFTRWLDSRSKVKLKELAKMSLNAANGQIDEACEEYNKIRWKGFPNFGTSPRKLLGQTNS